MKMNGEQLIAAPRQRVWEALNDPEILKQCIPGCQSLEKEADDRLKATVAIKIGPIGAKFNGAVTLSELDPPNGYLISGEGQGGTAGSAKGSARVSLADQGSGTMLRYTVDADVSGRLAQVGGVIIDATAKQLAGVFFKRFGEIVAVPAASEPASPAETSAPGQAPAAPVATASAPVAVQGAVPYPYPAAAATERSPSAFYWLITVFLAGIAGFLFASDGHYGSSAGGALVGIVIAGLALFSFEMGRRSKPAGQGRGA